MLPAALTNVAARPRAVAILFPARPGVILIRAASQRMGQVSDKSSGQVSDASANHPPNKARQFRAPARVPLISREQEKVHGEPGWGSGNEADGERWSKYRTGWAEVRK